MHTGNCKTPLVRVSTLRDRDLGCWNRSASIGAWAAAAAEICEHGPMPRRHRTVFRLPLMALVFPVLLLLCTIPLAGLGSWWNLMYLVPVLALVWAVTTRTTADAAGIRVSGLLRRRSIAWDLIDRLELGGPRWIVLVTRDGSRTRLPMVLTRDLPRLTARSGGKLSFDDELVATASPVAGAGPAPDSDPQG